MAKETDKDMAKETKTVDRQKFVERKLKAINQMKNQAKARAIAARVLAQK